MDSLKESDRPAETKIPESSNFQDFSNYTKSYSDELMITLSELNILMDALKTVNEVLARVTLQKPRQYQYRTSVTLNSSDKAPGLMDDAPFTTSGPEAS